MTDRELMQQVLDALEFDGFTPEDATHNNLVKAAIETLRTRLAQPEPEPWAYKHGGRPMTLREIMDAEDSGQSQREWQGLTDEEMSDAYNEKYNWYSEHVEYADFVLFYRAIEAKLKEKNT